jgi:hypothetical protein
VLLLSLSGCGSGRHEALAREQTELNEGLAAEWATVTDAESMKAAEPKLVEQYRRQLRLGREAKALVKPSDAQQEELSTKYARRVQAAVNKILQEQQRIHDQVPGGVEFLQRIGNSFKKPRDRGTAPAETAPGDRP